MQDNPENIKQIEEKGQRVFGKEKKIAVVSIVIMLLLISVMGGIIIYYETTNRHTLDVWMNKYDTLENKYNSLMTEHTSVEYLYNNLVVKYDDLTEDYNQLTKDYNELNEPIASIKNRTIYWRFFLLNNAQLEWSLDMATYLSYVQMSDPVTTVSLSNTNTGETYTVTDLTNYVTPDVFSGVISDLTNGRSDYDFVQEVVNIKNQLITYSSGLENQYRWAVETLTEGTGNCGDTSILMASLLKAGENREDYELKIYFWYCDSDNMNEPQKVNHVIVEVVYSNGTNQLIETTSNIFYTYDQIQGWKFEV